MLAKPGLRDTSGYVRLILCDGYIGVWLYLHGVHDTRPDMGSEVTTSTNMIPLV